MLSVLLLRVDLQHTLVTPEVRGQAVARACRVPARRGGGGGSPDPPALLRFPPGSPGPPWPQRGHTASRTQAALLLQRTHSAPGAGSSGLTVGGKTAEEFHLLPENLPGC